MQEWQLALMILHLSSMRGWPVHRTFWRGLTTVVFTVCRRPENESQVRNHIVNQEPPINEYLVNPRDSTIHSHEENASQDASSSANEELVGERMLLSQRTLSGSFSNAVKSAKSEESGGCVEKEGGGEESLQMIPATYFAFSEDVALATEGFDIQQKNTEVKVADTRDGLYGTGVNARTSMTNDGNNVHRLVSRDEQFIGVHDMTCLCTLKRWQLKRRRSDRRFARNASRWPSVIRGICNGWGSFDQGRIETSRTTTWISIPLEITEVIQEERMPVVSLTSKLSRKLITGHPIFVERVHRSSQGLCEHGTLPMLPVTGRRTAMLRVPRNCASVLSEGFGGLFAKRGQHPGNGCTAVLSHKMRVNRRKSNCIRCPPLEMSYSVFPKNVGVRFPSPEQLDTGACAQQTARMLLSTSVEQGDGANITSEVSAEQPLVTCIPVNLVFNRIWEALYKQQAYAPSDSDGLSVETSGKEICCSQSPSVVCKSNSSRGASEQKC